MIFGNINANGASYMIGEGPDQAEFSRIVQPAWAAFARTGDPNHTVLPNWPVFDIGRRATMFLDRTSRVQEDPFTVVRQVWNSLPFDGVSPAVEDLPRIADIKRYLVVRAVLAVTGMVLVGILLWVLLRLT